MAASPSNCFIAAATSHPSFTPSLHKPFNLKLPHLQKATPKFSCAVQHMRATLDDEAQISSLPSVSIKEPTLLNEVRYCGFQFLFLSNGFVFSSNSALLPALILFLC